MKFTLNKNQLRENPAQFMRTAGYISIYDKKSGHTSFVRTFGAGHYPRFHVYIDDETDKFTIKLHLDQKAPSYQGSKAHSGEYEGERVESELNRLKSLAGNAASQPIEPAGQTKSETTPETTPKTTPKTGAANQETKESGGGPKPGRATSKKPAAPGGLKNYQDSRLESGEKSGWFKKLFKK